MYIMCLSIHNSGNIVNNNIISSNIIGIVHVGNIDGMVAPWVWVDSRR